MYPPSLPCNITNLNFSPLTLIAFDSIYMLIKFVTRRKNYVISGIKIS